MIHYPPEEGDFVFAASRSVVWNHCKRYDQLVASGGSETVRKQHHIIHQRGLAVDGDVHSEEHLEWVDEVSAISSGSAM